MASSNTKLIELVELLLDVIDESAAQQVESRLHTIVEEALSSVKGFDITDHQDEIEDMIDKKVELLLNIIDESAVVAVESRLHIIVEKALSSVKGFDIYDHQDEIEDMIDKKVREMIFTVTVD
jgi:hypothetical protein